MRIEWPHEITAARGERVQIPITIKGPLNGVTLSDGFAVKSWYVAGTNPPYRGTKTFIGDLLLKNPSLVRAEGGENYVSGKWVSNPAELPSSPTVREFSVADSSEMTPHDITTQSYMAFVTASESTDYQVKVSDSSGELATISVRINVLPLDIHKYQTHVLTYGSLVKDVGTIGHYAKDVTQYAAEMSDINQHCDISTLSQPYYVGEPDTRFKTAWAMHRPTDWSSYFVSDWREFRDRNIEAVKLKARKIMALGPSVFQIEDEKQGTALAAFKPYFEAIQSVGGKTWACGHMARDCGTGNDNFAVLGAAQDIAVIAREPTTAEAANWHSIGKKVYCYAWPMSGGEKPEVYRRNYGFRLWQKDYDGALCIYQWCTGSCWNDFNGTGNWKPHIFAYPTAGNPIDTLGFEGWDAGRVDLHYVLALEEVADATAKAYLKTLKARDLSAVSNSTLTSIRKAIQGHLARIL